MQHDELGYTRNTTTWRQTASSSVRQQTSYNGALHRYAPGLLQLCYTCCNALHRPSAKRPLHRYESEAENMMPRRSTL
jgi:hypothetical protein